MRIFDTLQEWLAAMRERVPLRVLRWTLGVLIGLLILYYPIGMLWWHKINDDLGFDVTAQSLQPGQSRAVAVAAALIDREVNKTGWVANNPFFTPSAMLDNMPAYQQGIISALARFSFELADQIGRTRGSSEIDGDLKNASGLLQYSGTVWVWDPSVSLAPTATSEEQYEKARKALENYNRRLADGNAVFERRGDNLLATMERIALDLGSSSAVLERQVAEHSSDFIDFQADDMFYNVKGQTYAYYVVLRALGGDFENVLRERELAGVYAQMLNSLHEAAALDPWVVTNGAPDGFFPNSHLTAQGFYLLRARTQLREISDILRK
ncbi:MAG: hypothetical protein Dbin4_01744 [Alphaproteobacteria bacterium]|nr:hypothetical protein [Alphaproteobacteria bacterium]